ncbi:alanine racemase [Azospirillum sp. TSO22-1]|uniref:alanine racemase n=1 Tax=Azospirillum sp. TSO22-1 TaxID=716789 RepID=UPI000D6167CA|nr:alanine racemase [Azospirillum sp. TSO22-1]PWC52799.1 alanine racemase [Azospirillum sp. TSO22-1]
MTTMSASDPASFAGALLTIDLDAVVANWTLLRDRVGGPARCAAVVKADAYGLGASRVAPALFAAGCRTFVVAQVEEAIALRAVLPADAEVLSLGGLPPGSAAEFAAHGVTPVLNHLGDIEAWTAFCRERGEARPAVVHIDTGMNRLGLGPDELDCLIEQPERLTGMSVRLWMTHLACAEADTPMNAQQLGRFRMALARLPAAPASLANSSSVFLGPAYHFDLVRPGCALYGVNPTPAAANPMRPTVRLDARVLQVRSVDTAMTVGYGATHRVAGKGKVATIAVGYADGYPRTLSGRGHVFVGGIPAPVVGRISMDLITVDVTALPEGAVAPGALVELIGPNRPVDTVAEEAGTIGYEILTSLGRRYHRVHVGGTA